MKSKIIRKEEDWKALRKKLVTATEASTIIGLDRYRSASAMWKEKKERTFKGNAYTKLGQLLEQFVVDATNETLKEEFVLYEQMFKGKAFFYDEVNLVGATPDATNGKVLLECKTSNPTSWLKYSERPPDNYLMQVQIQLYCTELTEAYLSILSTDLSQSSQDFQWPVAIFKIQRNDKILKLFLTELERFWKCVKEGKIYKVDSEVKTKALLQIRLTHVRIA